MLLHGAFWGHVCHFGYPWLSGREKGWINYPPGANSKGNEQTVIARHRRFETILELFLGATRMETPRILPRGLGGGRGKIAGARKPLIAAPEFLLIPGVWKVARGLFAIDTEPGGLFWQAGEKNASWEKQGETSHCQGLGGMGWKGRRRGMGTWGGTGSWGEPDHEPHQAASVLA